MTDSSIQKDETDEEQFTCNVEGRYQGTRFKFIPNKLLQWMIENNHSQLISAQQELCRRATKLPILHISPSVIDSVSLNLTGSYFGTRRQQPLEGLYSWIYRLALEAQQKGQRRMSNWHYQGFIFVFDLDSPWPILIRMVKK